MATSRNFTRADRPKAGGGRFLIAYDIADPKRLRRVARRLEKTCLRVQQSVYLLRGEARDLQRILDGVRPLTSARDDVIEAWPIRPGDAARVGRARNVTPAAIVIGAGVAVVVPERRNGAGLGEGGER